jgi:hypothetical protein
MTPVQRAGWWFLGLVVWAVISLPWVLFALLSF